MQSMMYNTNNATCVYCVIVYSDDLSWWSEIIMAMHEIFLEIDIGVANIVVFVNAAQYV